MPNKGEKVRIFHSFSHNPWHNLSLEEYLFRTVAEDEIFLYLWQNQNTVVIGKNQNPWKECRLDQMKVDQVKLARRLSGGGAVYHDLGNLNFTFIAGKKKYDQERQFQVILRAINQLGLEAIFSGRNDLTISGKKFSGNAFYAEENAAYHHGTLLVNTDFEKMTRYLQVSKEKIISKGIDSIQARVINLSSFDESITIDRVAECMKQSFISEYGLAQEQILADDMVDTQILYDRYSSWDWVYGESPAFDITYTNRFVWGEIEIGFRLRNGYITESKVYSDSLETHIMDQIDGLWTNVPFDKKTIIEKLTSLQYISTVSPVINDLIEWMSRKEI